MGLEGLRARVRAIEGGGTALERPVARLGPGLDAHLPWSGLPTGALHELAGPARNVVAMAFLKACLARPGALLWCLDERTRQRSGEPWPPAMAAAGIDPARLLLVVGRDQGEVAWATAEGLRSPAIACTLAELDRLELTASRKLQLAVEAGGGTGLVLRGDRLDPAPNAALTRWWAEPLRSADLKNLILPDPPHHRQGSATADLRHRLDPVYRLDLWRAKGAAPATFTVELDHATLALALAPGMAARAGSTLGRSAGPRAAAR